ncbi:MAG: hypothetical protein ACRD9L_27340 [Bryobacteraceae bacterium]
MPHRLTTALASHNAALYCEDETEITRLVADFQAEHDPVGPTEAFLVEQLARAAWHTRRYGRMELGLVDLQMAQAAGRLECRRTQDRDRTNPEIHHNNTLLLGAAFHEDCDKDRRAQERMARLQDAAQRAFLRCLKALHNEQDRRRKTLAQPQRTRVRRSTTAEAAAQASTGSQSNLVVMQPAAKTAAPVTPSKARPARKIKPAAGKRPNLVVFRPAVNAAAPIVAGTDPPMNSAYSDGLPPAA